MVGGTRLLCPEHQISLATHCAWTRWLEKGSDCPWSPPPGFSGVAPRNTSLPDVTSIRGRRSAPWGAETPALGTQGAERAPPPLMLFTQLC